MVQQQLNTSILKRALKPTHVSYYPFGSPSLTISQSSSWPLYSDIHFQKAPSWPDRGFAKGKAISTGNQSRRICCCFWARFQKWYDATNGISQRQLPSTIWAHWKTAVCSFRRCYNFSLPQPSPYHSSNLGIHCCCFYSANRCQKRKILHACN